MKGRRVVSDSIARLIDPETRAELGITTAAESIQKAAASREKDERAQFTNWCLLHDIPLFRSASHKRVTFNVGWPDFLVIYGGRVLALEFKVYGNEPSEDQKAVHAHFARTGTDVLVCYSADEGIRRLRAWLWEFFRWEPKL